ncbi:unnamed protein product [Caenorhabditis angaria]|uniref:Uncharacterized protein n=1 Tax=Caenorhabditis angaria TaxID=860376 RepID=A0A9P1IKK1_9PELO|nr:unnamed protein product [Caenorhabditis angaria]
MRHFLVILFATCATVANGIGTMLVQGRADTIRTLRMIVRHTAQMRQIDQPTLPSIDEFIQKSKNELILRKLSRGRRHINNVVLHTEECDHVDLMDCSDFDTSEMTCAVTATGMTCCVCAGKLTRRSLTLFPPTSTT